MLRYRYLIVGGGMAAASAADGIGEVDEVGSVGIVADEASPAYDRPPLSKGLWKGDSEEGIWRQTRSPRVRYHLGRRIEKLDLNSQVAFDDQGDSYEYEKVLLATGGSPRRLPFGGKDVIYFRTLEDYRRLRALADTGDSFAVIGGGFIGTEVAAALAMSGKRVTMIFPEVVLGSRVYPTDLARYLSEYYAQRGVRLLPGESVTGIGRDGARSSVQTTSGTEILVDGIVAGLGITPNVHLAREAGLEVRSGIVVDELLRASAPNVFAAGDVAEFFNPALDRWLRVEHEDNANTMGRLAGRSMAGDPEPYHHLPFFYSDLFDQGYEAVGTLDSRLETFEDWTEPFREGVVYYLGEGRVRGVLLWNVWGQVETARALIAEQEPFRAQDLRGRIAAVASEAAA